MNYQARGAGGSRMRGAPASAANLQSSAGLTPPKALEPVSAGRELAANAQRAAYLTLPKALALVSRPRHGRRGGSSRGRRRRRTAEIVSPLLGPVSRARLASPGSNPMS